MYSGDWKCADCNNAITELPFEPRDTSNLRCRDCFAKNRGQQISSFKINNALSGVVYFCCRTGTRTPIAWTKTKCPTIRRSGNILWLIDYHNFHQFSTCVIGS